MPQSESHKVVHIYSGQCCTFTPALTGVPFEEKFAALKARLEEQFAEGTQLEADIKAALEQVPSDV